MAAGSGSRQRAKRKADCNTPQSRSSVQTSTRLAGRKQSKLPFKTSRSAKRPVRRAFVDMKKVMYRSNISGVMKTVMEFDFSARHVKQLQKTPFWLMIDAIRVHKLDPAAFKKCDATVCRVIKTYNPIDEKFYIGGVGLPIRNSDIRLVFGLQCGREKLDLSHVGKGPADFIQRRCPNISRISSKVIKDALVVAMHGMTERDEEDVAKLMCLYICAKLFFPTTGESIGWAFVRVVDKLETLRLYDWTATIRNVLVSSLNDAHNRPERVTGCVVALLFLLCEHTDITQPDRPDVAPRFCRWNLGKLIGKLRNVELSVEGSFEVNPDKLSASVIERYFVDKSAEAEGIAEGVGKVLVVEPVSTWNGLSSDAPDAAVNVAEPSLRCWQPDSPNGGEVEWTSANKNEEARSTKPYGKTNEDSNTLADDRSCPVFFPDLLDLASTQPEGSVCEDTNDVSEQLEKAMRRITELEKDVCVKAAELRDVDAKVATMERLIGSQTTNLFMGFESLLVAKDAEILRLKTLVEKLEARITILEDHVDEFEVHEVTQSVFKEKNEQNASWENNCGKVNNSESVSVTGSRERVSDGCGRIANTIAATTDDVTEMDWVRKLDDGQLVKRNWDLSTEGADVGNVVGSGKKNNIVNVESIPMNKTDRLKDIRPSPDMPSLVRRVKSKARHEFRLSDYEYPNLGGRGKLKWKMGNKENVGPEVIYDVEDVEVGNKTWKGFGMSRKHDVWNMLDEDDIMLLKRVYTFDGDGAVIWDGGESGVQVLFGDIRDLVQSSCIQGNVIDAYAAILMGSQGKGVDNLEVGGSSYVFSSVCSDFMRNPNALSRGKYLNVQIRAAKGHRYTQYPVYHANHWTVMVHDTVSGSWQHYNSCKPRRGKRDEHYNEALKLKQWVEEYYRKFVWPRLALGTVRMPDFDRPLVSVVDCPQQSPETSDCAIFVCYIMRQYMHGFDIGSTMEGTTPVELRAAMVKMFLNDAGRGLISAIR